MRLAVVGAGLCGVAFVVHLARQLRGREDLDLELMVINRKLGFARGMAYGTHSASHLLNVPAGRMSLFADQPNDFLDYLVQQGLPSDPVSFVPRSHFGNYLKQRFEEAVASLPMGVRLVHVADEAVAGRPLSNGGLDLTLSNGSQVLADVLVLSTGNFLPTWPQHFSDALTDHPERFITDPWDWMSRHSVPEHWKKLLIVGSGLTMMDLAIDLSAKNFVGELTVLSRRGLLPQPHRAHGAVHLKTDWAEVQNKSPRLILRLLREFGLKHPDADWRDGIASIRDVTSAIWIHWSAKERKQFLRHLRSFWDVHRHRCAPYVHRQIQALMNQGDLVLSKGRIAGVAVNEDGVHVNLALRGRPETEELGPFDAVFNCTGPSVGIGANAHPFLKQLADQGLIMPDELNLGIEVADDYSVHAECRIHYLGPMLRASFWEATAVPELRVHAHQLAGLIAERM